MPGRVLTQPCVADGSRQRHLYSGKRARKDILAWMKKRSKRVAEHWDGVQAIVKNISEEIKAKKAALAEERAEQERRSEQYEKVEADHCGELQQGGNELVFFTGLYYRRRWYCQAYYCARSRRDTPRSEPCQGTLHRPIARRNCFRL